MSASAWRPLVSFAFATQVLSAIALGGCAGDRDARRASESDAPGATAQDAAHAPPEHGPWSLSVDVRADSAAGILRVDPPAARVWVERVSGAPPSTGSPAPAPITRAPGAPEAPLPDAAPDAPDGWPAPPALAVDPGLKPPVLRRAAPLALPAVRPARATTVELDVQVDAGGAVSDVVWAGGSADSALVRAAIACARAMVFHPALRAGEPIAVWCRQRFDFGGR